GGDRRAGGAQLPGRYHRGHRWRHGEREALRRQDGSEGGDARQRVEDRGSALALTMPRPLWPLMAVVALLTGCGSGRPISYRTQDRQVYDDMCTQGHNVWRMMYTGTDSAWHYFHVNDMDRWAWVRIPADQLVMAEPVPAGVTDDTLK